MEKGFFEALFDFNFSEFITTRIIKLLYILSIIGCAFFSVSTFISMVRLGGGFILLGIILAPIVFILSVIVARIYLELLIVIFRIAENTGKTADNTSKE